LARARRVKNGEFLLLLLLVLSPWSFPVLIVRVVFVSIVLALSSLIRGLAFLSSRLLTFGGSLLLGNILACFLACIFDTNFLIIILVFMLHVCPVGFGGLLRVLRLAFHSNQCVYNMNIYI
jgi:hypothetical protein